MRIKQLFEDVENYVNSRPTLEAAIAVLLGFVCVVVYAAIVFMVMP